MMIPRERMWAVVGSPVRGWPSRLACREGSARLLVLMMLGLVVGLLSLGVGTPPALAGTAATPAPHWTVDAYAIPTYVVPATNEKTVYEIEAHNDGAAPTDGVSTITITDTLPAGVTPAETPKGNAVFGVQEKLKCEKISAQVVSCQWNQSTQGPVPPGGSFVMKLAVNVEPEPAVSGTVTDTVAVEGGGASNAFASVLSPVSTAEPPFGIDTFAFGATDLAGLSDTQAGGHPYALTTNLNFSTLLSKHIGLTAYEAPEGGDKNLVTDLPLGLIGDPQAVPQCPESDITTSPVSCPSPSQVGVLLTRVEGEPKREVTGGDGEIPVYNVAPSHGFPAELGFSFDGQPVILFVGLRPAPAADPGEYGLRVTVPGVEREVPLTGVELTIWGTPAEARHDAQRAVTGSCVISCTYGAKAEVAERPYLTNPADCAGPGASAQVLADSWYRPALVPMNADGTPNFGAVSFTEPEWKQTSAEQPAVTECNALAFNPTLTFSPDTSVAGAPTGPIVDLSVPQPPDPRTLATPPLKAAVVTLPEGLVVNPSSAGGLLGCSPSQAGAGSTEPAACPSQSQIGTAEVQTPLLEKTLPGEVFLGDPECDPCSDSDAEMGRLIKLYIQVDDPERGVIVKLPGTVKLDPVTGQLTATFDQNPQLPFSNLKLEFKTGPRAPLVTPQTCGSYQTSSVLMPWSATETPTVTSLNEFTPAATSLSEFTISQNCNARGFAPSLSAGTINNQAGAYSPFVTTISRTDADQDLATIALTTPPGLLGTLKNVVQCPEAQANAGTCGPESQIGETTATAGAGSEPFQVNGGRVYLTGPYNNGPFGLSIVVPAVAGPFNLGNVVVRASIRVNPSTGQITVLSDPLPRMLDGIPLQIKTVYVTINRPDFMFNPTNCEALKLEGTITSTQGATASVGSPFEAANCGTLPFHPSLSASTQGATSKAGGASFAVKVTNGAGDANIHKVDLQLPLALPARLTTLQKACTEAQFAANPAGCPEGSVIGTAIARTPVLNAPLTGPAYLVSHGGAAFPDVEFVLQGENGIEIVLDGKTDIKHGITYSRFETVPDAPVSSFETTLPEGPHSALAANGDLCAPTTTRSVKRRVTIRSKGHRRTVTRTIKQTIPAPLTAPTTITGQNGAVISQSTKIQVTGCPRSKPKPAKKAKPTGRGRKGAKKG